MRRESKETNNFFRIAAFVMLILLAIEIPIVLFARNVSYNDYIVEYNQLVVSGEKEKADKLALPVEIPDAIYVYNCVLCVISAILILVYALNEFSDICFKGKFDIKKAVVKNWPCILLAIFMIWTGVGCIQASMEAGAEHYVSTHSSGDDNYDYYLSISNWSKTDRMDNAADRSWNGCKNLKDGYFSFLFYATVLLNVMLLGVGGENYKRYLMRVLLISSFILGFFTFLSFIKYSSLSGIVYFDRSIFNNRNHFGYYISVILIMSAALASTDKVLYFKILAFINSLLYIFLLFACNTFGAYLGVLFGMIALLIVLVIKAISKHEFKGLAIFAPILLAFIFMSCTFVSCKAALYKTSKTSFDYTTCTFTIGNNSYMLSINSLTEEQAKAYNINSKSNKDDKIYWGSQINKLDKRVNTFVYNNFKYDLFNGFEKVLEYFKKNEMNPVESGDNIGLDKETKEFLNEVMKNYPIVDGETGAEYGTRQNLIINAIASKYPKVSGETFEEWQAREDSISELYQKYVEYSSDVAPENSQESDDALSEIAKVGSGRAPVWIRSLDLMNQRPWFGWGLENLLNEFYEQYNISEGRTHNLVLQLGGTVGIPGMLMYLIATISIWLKVLFDAKAKKYSKNQLWIILGVFVIIAALVNIIIFKYVHKLFFNGMITTMVLAVLSLYVFVENREFDEIVKRNLIIYAIFLAIVSVVLGALKLNIVAILFIDLIVSCFVIFVIIKKIHFRVPDFNEFETISSVIFVSYMINSLFGNSAFYTSPYFMIFMGMLTFEMLNKENFYELALAKAEGNDNKTKAKTNKKLNK